MQAVFEHLEFRLESRDVLSLTRAAAAAITVVKGSIWVTQDGSARDHVLRCGETLRVEGDAAVVLGALSPARVSVAAPARPRGAVARLWRRLVAAYLQVARRARRRVAAGVTAAAAL